MKTESTVILHRGAGTKTSGTRARAFLFQKPVLVLRPARSKGHHPPPTTHHPLLTTHPSPLILISRQQANSTEGPLHLRMSPNLSTFTTCQKHIYFRSIITRPPPTTTNHHHHRPYHLTKECATPPPSLLSLNLISLKLIHHNVALSGLHLGLSINLRNTLSAHSKSHTFKKLVPL